MPRRPGTRRWLKMGVELEGAWDLHYRDVAGTVKGAEGKEDGSVKNLAGYKGEIITRPHTILDHLCKDVEALYPNRVNETCGFHIHTSFDPLEYSTLADAPFWRYYRDRWEAWGKANEAAMDAISKREFWDRWHGRSDRARRYCKAEFKPVTQLVDREDRYTQLNFTSYHKYQTLESRLLPMFANKDLAVLAIREMSDIFDTFLNDHDFPVISFETEFIMDGEVAVEEKKLKMPRYEPWQEEHEEKPTKGLPTGEDIYYHITGTADYMLPLGVGGEEP